MLKKLLPLAVAATCMATPAFAAMPLITDDTGTQGKGRFQTELGFEAFRDESDPGGITVKDSGGMTAATLSYGLSEKIDLIAGVPWVWYEVREDGVRTGRENGMGDLALQLKWRFFDMENGKLSLAVKPGITLPTGDEYNGLGNGRVSGGAMLVATHRAELTAMHLNLGYTRNQYRLETDRIASKRDIWHASLAGELNVTKNLRTVADIGLETNQSKDSDTTPAYILGGMIYSVSDNVDLDLGIKGALNEAETDTTLLAGVTIHM